MLETPKALRLHIGLFGRRNVGKSSLLNALSGQTVAIVSDTPGTTTDPVEKVMELAPLGPVVWLDTAGLDDAGGLGEQRVERSLRAAQGVDLAIIVTADGLWGDCERELAARLRARRVPFMAVLNKVDAAPEAGGEEAAVRMLFPEAPAAFPVVSASALTGRGIDAVLDAVVGLARASAGEAEEARPLAADLIPAGGLALLVVPIDSGAPKGRLILPQVQTIRDILDGRGLCMVLTEEELASAFSRLREPPDLVICDSQVVRRVAAETPPATPLTTFSILMARLKGDLTELAAGAAAIRRLRPGDRVLVQEACSHHPQQDDIGRVKIPRLLEAQAGGALVFATAAGRTFAEPGTDCRLIVHCGGCALTRGQMLRRLEAAREAGVPMTNYGVAISCCQGVLERALGPFPQALVAYRKALSASPRD